MIAWLTSAKGIVVALLVLVMVVSIIAVTQCAERQQTRAEKQQFNAGQTEERAARQSETINRVQEARDAQDELRNGGSAELERVRSRYDRSHQNRQ